MTAQHGQTGPLSGGTMSSNGAGYAGPLSASPAGNGVSPSIALSEASLPPHVTLETVLSRDLAMHIIGLYFEHVSKRRRNEDRWR